MIDKCLRKTIVLLFLLTLSIPQLLNANDIKLIKPSTMIKIGTCIMELEDFPRFGKMAADGYGNIWVSSSNSIYFDPFHINVLSHYSKKDGFIINYPIKVSSFLNNNKKLYCLEQISENTYKLFLLDPSLGPIFQKMIKSSYNFTFNSLSDTAALNNEYLIFTETKAQENIILHFSSIKNDTVFTYDLDIKCGASLITADEESVYIITTSWGESKSMLYRINIKDGSIKQTFGIPNTDFIGYGSQFKLMDNQLVFYICYKYFSIKLNNTGKIQSSKEYSLHDIIDDSINLIAIRNDEIYISTELKGKDSILCLNNSFDNNKKWNMETIHQTQTNEQTLYSISGIAVNNNSLYISTPDSIKIFTNDVYSKSISVERDDYIKDLALNNKNQLVILPYASGNIGLLNNNKIKWIKESGNTYFEHQSVISLNESFLILNSEYPNSLYLTKYDGSKISPFLKLKNANPFFTDITENRTNYFIVFDNVLHKLNKKGEIIISKKYTEYAAGPVEYNEFLKSVVICAGSELLFINPISLGIEGKIDLFGLIPESFIHLSITEEGTIYIASRSGFIYKIII